MPAIKLAELECMNSRLYSGEMGNRDYSSGALEINRTSLYKIYADTLYRVLSTITKIKDAQ